MTRSIRIILSDMAITKLLLAAPRGFCAGVARAVKAVEDTIEIFGAPVYVKHEIVHNKHVVSDIGKKGAITIEDLDEVPDNSVVVFSAHGSPPDHYEVAKKRGLTLIDATCPLVTKVHLEVQRYLKNGYQIVYIGHAGHIEGIGVRGEGKGADIPLVESVADVDKLKMERSEKMVYLTQTTLSIDDTRDVIDALKKKYPQITAPPMEDICYATTNRQTAVKALAKVVNLVLILGSKTSSNSTRLMETARGEGAASYLIDDVGQIDLAWLDGVESVGISAGASAPEKLVQGVVEYFEKGLGIIAEEFMVTPEKMFFAEPVELMKIRRDRRERQGAAILRPPDQKAHS